jgi:hypothetical protein
MSGDVLYVPCVFNENTCFIDKPVGNPMKKDKAEKFLKTWYAELWLASEAIPVRIDSAKFGGKDGKYSEYF